MLSAAEYFTHTLAEAERLDEAGDFAQRARARFKQLGGPPDVPKPPLNVPKPPYRPRLADGFIKGCPTWTCRFGS